MSGLEYECQSSSLYIFPRTAMSPVLISSQASSMPAIQRKSSSGLLAMMFSFFRNLPALSIGSAQPHAGAAGTSHQFTVLIDDVTFGEADGAARLHHTPFGGKLRVPHRPQEIDLQFQGGKSLALSQVRCIGNTHGGVGDVAENPPVQSPHGIGVLATGLEFYLGVAAIHRNKLKADEFSDRSTFSLDCAAQVINHGICSLAHGRSRCHCSEKDSCLTYSSSVRATNPGLSIAIMYGEEACSTMRAR